MNLDPISEDVIQREIEAAIADGPGERYNKVVLNEVQMEALLKMRRAGVPWPRVMEIWAQAGWPGSPNTLMRIVREAERNGNP